MTDFDKLAQKAVDLFAADSGVQSDACALNEHPEIFFGD
jgi:hypothetical protein